jgi:hypothetical protein
VFRGPSASLFPIIVTPSVFKSVISGEDKDTGYHINLEAAPTSGTTKGFDAIYTTSDVHVDVFLYLSNDALYTRRLAIMRQVTMISNLLGSVFALMGVFQVLMRGFEKISEKSALKAK